MAEYDTVDEILNAVDKALIPIMEGKIYDGYARDALFISIGMNVYSMPEGRYKRRDTNGGLHDPKNFVANYDPSTRELTVEDMAMGTRKHSGQRLDKLVETGTGYDYGGNALFPRPFYDSADHILSQDPIYSGMDKVLEEELNELV